MHFIYNGKGGEKVHYCQKTHQIQSSDINKLFSNKARSLTGKNKTYETNYGIFRLYELWKKSFSISFFSMFSGKLSI